MQPLHSFWCFGKRHPLGAFRSSTKKPFSFSSSSRSMEDRNAKPSRNSSGTDSKPGAFASGGDNEAPAASPPMMSQMEVDILTKQQGRNSRASLEATKSLRSPSNSQRPGIVPQQQEAPDSRLVAKLRGEVPQNWNSATPMQSELARREDQVQQKVRGSEASVPGAMATLSNLQDEAIAKQGAVSVSIAAVGKPPVELVQRDEMAAAKSSQVSQILSSTPQRLQDAEQLVDVKMREFLDDSKMCAGPGGKRDENLVDLDKDSQPLEYGEFGGPNEEGLAVAFAVEEEVNNTFLPSAVEYDPDAKPPIFRNRRFRMYVCLALSTLIIGTVGAVLGILLTDDEAPAEIPYRASLGIQENIELLLDNPKVLNDTTNPYRKALDWIMYHDAMEVTPEDSNFYQRFLAVYFYYATSMKKPWGGECAPEGGEEGSCRYPYVLSLVPPTTIDRSGIRWLSGVDECTWVGVDCDESRQIREIDLSTFFCRLFLYVLFSFFFLNRNFRMSGGVNMTGTFPEGLIKLPYLQSLLLHFGELEGTLPANLADYTHLNVISLGYNAFTGTLPDRWLESRNLRAILVQGNNITGQLTNNISELKDLKQLVLGENDFYGTIPTQVGAIPSLVELTLDQNRLNGTIPTEIGIASLWTLYLYRNQLTGVIPSEIGLTIAIDLRIHVNRLTGPIPEEFWVLTDLWRIDLSENSLSGSISGQISRFADLEELYINSNQFTGNLPQRLGSLQFLKEVVAWDNNFNGTVPDQVCDSRERGQLEELQMDCLEGNGGAAPEVVCPEDCCTLCCHDGDSTCLVV